MVTIIGTGGLWGIVGAADVSSVCSADCCVLNDTYKRRHQTVDQIAAQENSVFT